jgi:hypothetical protein
MLDREDERKAAPGRKLLEARSGTPSPRVDYDTCWPRCMPVNRLVFRSALSYDWPRRTTSREGNEDSICTREWKANEEKQRTVDTT